MYCYPNIYLDIVSESVDKKHTTLFPKLSKYDFIGSGLIDDETRKFAGDRHIAWDLNLQGAPWHGFLFREVYEVVKT